VHEQEQESNIGSISHRLSKRVLSCRQIIAALYFDSVFHGVPHWPSPT
jgi:hypothetical protein